MRSAFLGRGAALRRDRPAPHGSLPSGRGVLLAGARRGYRVPTYVERRGLPVLVGVARGRGLAGPLTYGLVAAAVSYVMIKHILMGACLMSFFIAIRKDVHYVFDMTDADGFHGWKDARALVQGVIVSVLISLVAFGSLFLSLSVHQVRWTTPLLLLFLLGVPTYFVGPLLLIRRAMRGFREREIARLQGCFADLRGARARTHWNGSR